MQGTRPGTIEEKAARLEQLRKQMPQSFVREFDERFLMSWIYHDSGLEGVVYTPQELISALSGAEPPDSSLEPTYEEIRQNKAAIDFIKDCVDKPRVLVDLELVKKVYLVLAPDEEENAKNLKLLFRKDIPVHRVYFHDIAPPDKIQAQLTALFAWVKEEKKTKTHPIRFAARVHHDLLQTSPFPQHSGKVARLVMNLILLRNGYPPAIIHSTERQKYYEALKNGPNFVAQLVQDSINASLESGLHFFEQAKQRSSGGLLRSP